MVTRATDVLPFWDCLCLSFSSITIPRSFRGPPAPDTFLHWEQAGCAHSYHDTLLSTRTLPPSVGMPAQLLLPILHPVSTYLPQVMNLSGEHFTPNDDD